MATIITGSRFGRLTVLRFGDQVQGASKYKHARWWCSCECGSGEALYYASALRSGNTRSCGCLRRETSSRRSGTHRQSGFYTGTQTTEYRTWLSMRNRCNNPRNRSYEDYGGRGISVCERWDAFEAFLSDMGKRPSAQHSLDRIDHNGNYEPSNCRWATVHEQQRNRRSNVRLTLDGETRTLAEWEEIAPVTRNTIRSRVRAGATTKAVALAPAGSASIR